MSLIELPGIAVAMQGHAFDHFSDTKHVYCQNLETQEVWDFSKEDYVDRILHN
jgi:hypothetical protein